MAKREEIKSSIIEFLKQLSPRARDYALADETNMVQTGLLDSFALLDLLAKLEERFHLSLDVADFEFDTFTTIGGMTDVIASQLA